MTKQTAEYLKQVSATPAGKGSRYRPCSKKKFDKEFERIFGRKGKWKRLKGSVTHSDCLASRMR